MTYSGTGMLLSLVAVVGASGCTHTQLRWNTVHQSLTLTDIYEQQVLDNLAMFVSNPHSLPSFAFPNQGGGDVTDNGGGQSSTIWNRLGFSQTTLNLSAGRQMRESWTLTPVFDPRRLELMRCAYQHAIANAGIDFIASGCPNCEKLQRRFYTGSESGDDILTYTLETGRTTPACLNAKPWLGWGCKKCVPKNVKCIKVGHYCGVYIWVLPDGQDELSKLTLIILDYAFNTPPPPPAARPVLTKDVTWYLDETNKPTTKDKAVKVIQATLPYSEAVEFPRAIPRATDGEVQLETIPTPFAPPNIGNLSPLGVEQTLRFLTPQQP